MREEEKGLHFFNKITVGEEKNGANTVPVYDVKSP